MLYLGRQTRLSWNSISTIFFFANQSQRLIKRRHLKLQGFTQTSHLPAAYSTSDLSVSIVVPNNYVFHKCMGSVDSLSSTVLTT